MAIAKALAALVMTNEVMPETRFESVIEILIAIAAVYYTPTKGKNPLTQQKLMVINTENKRLSTLDTQYMPLVLFKG